MTQQIYLQYWQQFCRILTERGSLVCYEPKDAYYLGRNLGKGIRLSPVASKGKRYISVEVILKGDTAKKRYASLGKQREEIDKELGEACVWRDEPGNKQCDIKLRREGCDISDQAQWAEQHNWLYAKLQLFHAVFAHRIKGL